MKLYYINYIYIYYTLVHVLHYYTNYYAKGLCWLTTSHELDANSQVFSGGCPVWYNTALHH